MYNNFQQPSTYQSPSTGPYAPPIYPNQYEQMQYANNQYTNQPSQTMYETAPNQPPIHSISTQQQFPSQTMYETAPNQPPIHSISTQQQFPSQFQYVDNNHMNQPSQPMDDTVPNQSPIYSISTQQQFSPPSQYVNNQYTNQPSQSTYETAPNQLPIYSAATQQQFLSQPQYVDNNYVKQQLPPPYPTAVQELPHSTSIQLPKKFPNINLNFSTNNPKSPETPFSKGYKWPRKSITVVCPQCGASVKTRLETATTFVTICACFLLFCFTCILACLPFCISSCKKSTHYCPRCHSMLGVRPELK